MGILYQYEGDPGSARKDHRQTALRCGDFRASGAEVGAI